MVRAAAGDHKKPEFESMNHSISCGSIEQEHHRREAWRQVCREVLQSLGRRRLPTSIHSRLACYRCEIAFWRIWSYLYFRFRWAAPSRHGRSIYWLRDNSCPESEHPPVRNEANPKSSAPPPVRTMA